jgi:Phosphotransferase enzyme family
VTCKAEYEPADIVTQEILEQSLPSFRGREKLGVLHTTISPLNLGTSGARLFSVDVATDTVQEPLALLLKISRPGRLTEAYFYRDLASTIPLSTPAVVATGIAGDSGWVLMEKFEARPHSSWKDVDYKIVIEDMARLHAHYWGNVDSIRRSWLEEMSLERVQERARELVELSRRIEDSWLAGAAPEIFENGRLARVRDALDNAETIAQPLREAGLTFVHGDYWFFNALLTADGRRFMVDWQGPMIWSGFWELAYFMNLLLALDGDGFRDIPVPERNLGQWFQAALRSHGIEFS